jgi:hypothetical protein
MQIREVTIARQGRLKSLRARPSVMEESTPRGPADLPRVGRPGLSLRYYADERDAEGSHENDSCTHNGLTRGEEHDTSEGETLGPPAGGVRPPAHRRSCWASAPDERDHTGPGPGTPQTQGLNMRARANHFERPPTTHGSSGATATGGMGTCAPLSPGGPTLQVRAARVLPGARAWKALYTSWPCTQGWLGMALPNEVPTITHQDVERPSPRFC